jgi:hypothetical protein
MMGTAGLEPETGVAKIMMRRFCFAAADLHCFRAGTRPPSGRASERADCAAGAGGRGARLRADLAGAASDHRDDDLALGPAAFDVGERLCGFIERVRPVDDGTEGSGVDELGDLA